MRLHNTRLYFREGVRVDGDGRAYPYIINDLRENRGQAVIEYARWPSGWEGMRYVVPASQIEIRFEGMREFFVQADD